MLSEEDFALFLSRILEEELDVLFKSRIELQCAIRRQRDSPVIFSLSTFGFSAFQYYTIVDSVNDLVKDFPILKFSNFSYDTCLLFVLTPEQVNFIQSYLASDPLKPSFCRNNVHYE